MALSDGLLAYWKLDEASGNALDAAGAEELTDTNTVGNRSGVSYSTMRDFIAASSEKLTRASDATLQFGDDAFTFCCQCILDLNDGNRTVFAKWAADGATTTLEYALRYIHGSTTFVFYVGDGTNNTTVTSTAPSVTSGVNYFIACGHDPTNNVIFIRLCTASNNPTTDTAAHSTGVLAGSSGFAIGSTGEFDGQYWDGGIGPMALWSRVLSSDEITEVRNGGTMLTYAQLTTVAPPVQQSLLLAGRSNLIIPNLRIR